MEPLAIKSEGELTSSQSAHRVAPAQVHAHGLGQCSLLGD